MTSRWTAALLTVLALLAPVASAEGATITYSGQGTAVEATVLGVTTVISQTDPLPPSGGSRQASLASATVPGLLTAQALSASAKGDGQQSQTKASIADVALTVIGHTITAELLSSQATARCTATGPVLAGSARILQLAIDGHAVTVTGHPNQTVALPGGVGQVVINEQRTFVNGSKAEIEVTALRVVVAGVADVALASSHADIDCDATLECRPPITYSGQATVLSAEVLGVLTRVADTGPLPETGGSRQQALVSAAVPGLLSARALAASTVGSGEQSQSTASVADVDLTVAGITITADLLTSIATATCDAGAAAVVGNAQIVNLTINGIGVTVTGSPNQQIPLPLGLGHIVLNEQVGSASGSTGDLTVTALRVVVTGVADVAVASSHADIACVPPPRSFSGQATVVDATVGGINTLISDTGPLPAGGGSRESGLPAVTVPGLLTAQLLAASTAGSGSESQSSASVAALALTVHGLTITAQVLSSTATATCTGDSAAASGSSVVLNLAINGVPVVVSGHPNQTVGLPGGIGQLVINEQITSVGGGTASITVNALHVRIGSTVDVVIASSHADIRCRALDACPVLPGVPAPTTKDATLLHAAKNQNNGANLSLRARYQVAALVGFDVRSIPSPAAIERAVLRLTVCFTPGDATLCPDPSHDWAAGGDRLTAFRLEPGHEGWGGAPAPQVEGDGDNFPIPASPRGTGAGVTWSCKVDANIANEAQNCPSSWNGGNGVQGAARPALTLLTDNMPDGTTVEFDVTADVKAGLGADTAFMSWFVRKVSGSGFASFYSREGAAALGNPALAPQLIVTP